MMKLFQILFFFVLFFLGNQLFAQENQDKSASENKKELLVFSNDGCGKCSVTEKFLEQNHMPYTKYAVKENRILMYEYVHKKTGPKSAGIGYPVLVYGDSIYFSMKNINAVLEEIKTMMEKDGMIEKIKENPIQQE